MTRSFTGIFPFDRAFRGINAGRFCVDANDAPGKRTAGRTGRQSLALMTIADSGDQSTR